jgi:hypothetical protein
MSFISHICALSTSGISVPHKLDLADREYPADPYPRFNEDLFRFNAISQIF